LTQQREKESATAMIEEMAAVVMTDGGKVAVMTDGGKVAVMTDGGKVAVMTDGGKVAVMEREEVGAPTTATRVIAAIITAGAGVVAMMIVVAVRANGWKFPHRMDSLRRSCQWRRVWTDWPRKSSQADAPIRCSTLPS
jgi:Fe-S cluster biogenesis protein NfuA